ncbi:ABC transporter substrate-binding protein [Demequina lignilytica]|uniref:Sugar ABC transporter substrate-binding protein n=1 Tax=Demequina lignilytica TaxID=3051663 RepID=A0AB35MI56_9MICO|nr:sugar ABC transporter substrate-binding protein [Demequina sp. SYSU T0a273]MDN4483406.1 sugar ABC transporter substrate-binding protein [Demequina sp. SYSU T0a273]
MTPKKMLPGSVAVAAMGLLLTACSASAGSGGSGSEASGDPVDLRMTVWTSNEDHLAVFNAIADAYMADNPQVASITFDSLPFDDYTSTVTTQIAGGNAPDLAWILENTAPDFVESGALLPLNETLEATEGYQFDDLAEGATSLWLDDGQLMAYPFSTSPFVMFVNNDMLAEAGLPTAAEMLADSVWTWEDVDAAGQAVRESTGNAGFVIRDFDYQNWDFLSTVWNGWGAAPWSEDGATCTFADSEMVEAFEFLHSAAFESESMPGPGTSADFFAGEAAMTVTQISRANLLEGNFDWDLLPLPSGPAGDYAVTGQAGIGVIAQGENTQAAADFLAFFTNPENARQLAEFFPPPRESLLNVEVLSAANPLLTPEQIDNVVVPGIATGQVRPSHTGAAEIGQQVRSSLDALWTEDADIAAVLQATCGAIEPLL